MTTLKLRPFSVRVTSGWRWERGEWMEMGE